MTHTGYLGAPATNPAGLGATVIVNGAILALLLSMASGVVVDSDNGGIKIFKPFQAAPPPVEVDQPKAKTTHDKADQAKPRPRVAASAESQTASDNGIQTASEGGTSTGTGSEVIPALPPIVEDTPIIQPDPVRVAARIDPRHRATLQPPYPASRQRADDEGSVVVRILVGIDGRVKAVEAVRTDHDDFLRATRDQALRKWRFEPATVDGKPVESWREMTVHFELGEA